MTEDLAFEVLCGHGKLVRPRFLHVAYVFCGDSPTFLDDQLATKLDIEDRGLPAQALRHEAHLDVFFGQVKIVLVEEDVEHLLVA